MTRARGDRDLPGDATFRSAPAIVTVEVDTPTGTALAQAMTISPTEQANVHHNQLRYAELGRLRRAQANGYAATQYK